MKDRKQQKPEIKPCPFCGSKPKWMHISEKVARPELPNAFWSLTCENRNCAICPGASGDTKPEAIEAWNQRIPAAPLVTTEWHPASTPPDDEQTVLLALETGEVEPGFYDSSSNPPWCYINGTIADKRVLHWGHYPEPPKTAVLFVGVATTPRR